MAAVQLLDVTKVYAGRTRAVDGLTLDVRDGELLALVGPSGCGKTTTLRLIAGLEKPDSGTVHIGGREVTHDPPPQRDVALVFQNAAVYPHLSVRRNLGFGLHLRRRYACWGHPLARLLAPRRWQLARAEQQEIDRRVRETAALLGIAELLDRRPASLSGGERQRVALGRAIVRHPRVFLLDEPLSNLDARLRLAMRSELKQLQRRLQTTTICVTHDQEEALSLGDRVAVMRAGRLQQCGTPTKVYERPANRFVATFIGHPPMNLLEGRVVHAGGELCFVCGALHLPLPVEHKQRLSGHVKQNVVLGLRPESWHLVSATAKPPVLPAHVTSLDRLADRRILYCNTPDGIALTCCLDAQHPVSEGELLHLRPALNQAHYFAADHEGRALL